MTSVRRREKMRGKIEYAVEKEKAFDICQKERKDAREDRICGRERKGF